MKVLGQRDPRWASHPLGTIPAPLSTIGAYGCYLTSQCSVLNDAGVVILPDQLDDLYVQSNLFQDGNLLAGPEAAQYFPTSVKYINTLYFPGPADLDLINTYAADPSLRVVLGLDFDHDPNDGIQWHFSPLGLKGLDELYCTWYGDVAPFQLHYGDNPARTIQKAIIYELLNMPPTPSLPQPEPTMPDAVKAYFELLGYAINPATAIMQRAALAYAREETPGPAVSDEYPSPLGDGHIRQRFSNCTFDYDPSTGIVSRAEINVGEN